MPFERELQAAVDATFKVQNLLARDFGKAPVLAAKSNLASDIVTATDIEAQRIIAASLASFDKSIGFVGEEGGNTRGRERYWLVDPIDGTGLYVRGIPMSTSIISLIQEEEVVVSVVNNFILGELFTATKGGGARLNGTPIQVSNRPLREAYLAVETKLETPANIEQFVALRKRTIPTHFINCGYDLALVACGRLDGKLVNNGYGEDWDYTGTLLITEAGGRVSNLGLTTYDLKNHDFIAANPLVFAELTSGPDALFPIIH